METKELFELLTRTEQWWDGFISDRDAQVWKYRHREGTLSLKSYERLFNHFGYEKQLTWTAKP